MQTSLLGIAKKAKNRKDHRFGNLYELLNEKNLLDSWRYIRKNAAYGVDRISAEEYGRNLKENIRDLVARLKSKRYRAKLIRRQYIPKGKDENRPLGIPAIEDKLLQVAVKRILEAIYEQDFVWCSYGYRPNKGAIDAVEKLAGKLQFERFNYIVEADIKGFFDNIDHDRLIEMLKERIEDGALLRLIQKWLKAGVLETDGTIKHPATGTPQGGIISPVLSNVYLHYVLDTWFHKLVRNESSGRAYIIRYADDYVSAFQNKEDAEYFYKVLKQRLGKYGLELSEEKTRIIEFNQETQGSSRFTFLGFEYYWDKDMSGKAHLKRRTSPKKLQKSLANFTMWCRINRNMKLKEMFKQLNSKLRGYFNYYGVVGNLRSICRFHHQAMGILHKWLNRRSQRKSYNWNGYNELLKHFNVLQPYIVKRPKRQRVKILV